ncbi:MAG: thiamine pyrophosphate-dependent enzyme [bacterium]|nr:thiamine pyrophosphate-dependent enzyme [bacterium]MDE0602535.1 thiamine pyrophosphate-dependent enzyme [bacterium]
MTAGVARKVVEGLRAGGARRLFGVPGGGPNLEIVGDAATLGIPFTLFHTESAACIAASTYGLLSESVGAAVVTRGPGVASAANGVAQATLDKQPLVLVGDTVPLTNRSWVGHQQFDQPAMMRPVTKWSGTVGHSRTTRASEAAARLAAAHPQGAVHIDMDSSVAGDLPPDQPSLTRSGVFPDEMRGLVRKAERPLLIVGTGALPWTEEVRLVVADSGCPVLTTYHAKGLIDETTPEFGGLFTSSLLEEPLLRRSDLVLAVGVDPAEPLPRPFRYRMPVIEINPWANPRRFFPGEAEVRGEVGPILESLAPDLGRHRWAAGAGRKAWREARSALWEDGPGFTPHQAVKAVAEWSAGQGGATVTLDAGAHFLVAMPLLPVTEPRRILISNGLSTMGYALPAALGAALARPGTPAVCLTGDGGLGIPLAELETLARTGADVVVVVFNDAALTLIELKQSPGQGGHGAVRYRTIDFAAVARACGMEGVVAENQAQLAAALDGSRPRLVDARIDPTAYRTVIETARG